MVCFVFPPRFSGAATQAIVLARHLVKKGVPCEFVVPNVSHRALFRRTEESGIPVNRVAGGSYSFALSFMVFCYYDGMIFELSTFTVSRPAISYAWG